MWKVIGEFKQGSEVSKSWKQGDVTIEANIFSDSYCRYHCSVTAWIDGEIVWSEQNHHQRTAKDARWWRGDRVKDCKAWLKEKHPQ